MTSNSEPENVFSKKAYKLVLHRCPIVKCRMDYFSNTHEGRAVVTSVAGVDTVCIIDRNDKVHESSLRVRFKQESVSVRGSNEKAKNNKGRRTSKRKKLPTLQHFSAYYVEGEGLFSEYQLILIQGSKFETCNRIAANKNVEFDADLIEAMGSDANNATESVSLFLIYVILNLFFIFVDICMR